MFLVLLPTLEASIRNSAVERTSTQTITTLGDLSEVPGDGDVLSDSDAEAYTRRVAAEVRGVARFSDRSGTRHSAGAVSITDVFDLDDLTPEGDLAGHSPSAEPVGVRVVDRADGDRVVYSAVRVTQANVAVGIIEVAVPVVQPAAEISTLQARVMFAVVVVLLLATIAGIVMARILGRRIGRLAATAASLSAGDLSARAPEVSPREVATLAGGLNRMAERVDELVATVTGERDRARALVSGLAEGVVMIDPEADAVVVANDAALRMLGLPPGRDARLGDLPPDLVELVARARAGASPVVGPEITAAHGVSIAVAAVPLPHPAGTVVLTLRDVTQERMLERTRRDLVANVSHELRTPVTAIRGFLELMEDDAMPPEARREFVGLMAGEAERLQRLVDEQMQLARLDSGELPLVREPMDLAELVRAASRPRAVLAERDGVVLRVEAGSPVPMHGDPTRIEQVLLILLDNALRHTPAAGTVTVQAHVRGGDALMSVTDTGEGIPGDSIPSVFNRFYRADPARERGDGQGAGLGLAIARGIVRAHGGDIVVTSQRGHGACFTVRLPRDSG